MTEQEQYDERKRKCKSCFFCGSTTDSVFSIPLDGNRRKLWLQFCEVSENEKVESLYLCSKHFDDTCIKNNESRPTLIKNAVPTKKFESTESEIKRKRTAYRNCLLCGIVDDDDVSLHSFPMSNANCVLKWFKFCNVEADCVKKHHRLCSNHFKPNDFIPLKTCRRKDTIRHLRQDAFPTLKTGLMKLVEKLNITNDDQQRNFIPNESNVIPYEHEASDMVQLPNIGTSAISVSLETDSIAINSNDQQRNFIPNESNVIPCEHEASDMVQLPNIETSAISVSLETDSIAINSNDQQCNFIQNEASTAAHEELNTVSNTNENVTPIAASFKRSNLRYPGDKTPDLSTPRRATKSYRKVRQALFLTRRQKKILQVDNRRLRIRIQTYKDLIIHLKQQNLISERAADHFMENMPLSLQQLIKRRISSKKTKVPADLRAFALTLHFYSPRAYQYVRKHWNNTLPSISTLRRWTAVIDGRPGFTAEALNTLRLKTEGKSRILCNLVIDEMSIKEGLTYNKQKTRVYGYEDLGTALHEEDADMLSTAKNALVFLIVSLKEGWKIPIAYFMIKSLTGTERSKLINTALELLYDVKCDVRSITFDGAAVNQTSVNILGANFEVEKESFQPWFLHPRTKEKVYVFPDPCHMLKLIRNTVAEKGPLIDSDGRSIDWEYISKLHKFEEQCGVRFATKLTNKHINFKNNKMNVRLAAQTLSHSVYAALKYLDIRKVPEFKDSFGTANFCAVFNNVFDILNCRSLFSKTRLNVPIKENNFAMMKKVANLCITYIKDLQILVKAKQTSDSDVESDPDDPDVLVPSATPTLQWRKVITSARKTGFVGMIICLTNIFNLYRDVTANPNYNMTYILTYRLLQDHIENFFSAVRSRGGFSNNPSAERFENAYKNLLLHHQIKEAETGNCAFSDLVILSVNNHTENKTNPICNFDTDEEKFDEDDLLSKDFEENLCTLAPYVEDIVSYIGGFIVRKLFRRNICEHCKPHLLAGDVGEQSLFMSIKSKVGGLKNPSKDVIKICTAAEKFLRQCLNSTNNMIKATYAKNVALKTNILIAEDVFNDRSMKDHDMNYGAFNTHKVALIKLIAETYASIRIHHECKKRSQRNEYIRQKYHKLILFQGQ